jgi:hypothetical protein
VLRLPDRASKADDLGVLLQHVLSVSGEQALKSAIFQTKYSCYFSLQFQSFWSIMVNYDNWEAKNGSQI